MNVSVDSEAQCGISQQPCYLAAGWGNWGLRVLAVANIWQVPLPLSLQTHAHRYVLLFGQCCRCKAVWCALKQLGGLQAHAAPLHQQHKYVSSRNPGAAFTSSTKARAGDP